MKFIKQLFFSTVVVASFAQGCATTASYEHANALPTEGWPSKYENTFSMGYRVATKINAPADKIWKILIDAPEYPKWNSTVTNIQGIIGPGEDIVLKSTTAPDREFALHVSEFEQNKRMVWQDGTSGIFKGVRTYTLISQQDGSTDFSMIENFAGAMLPMIKGSLPDFTASFHDFAADLKRKAEVK